MTARASPSDAVRTRALELSREIRGCRAIAAKLSAEGLKVSKTLVSEWLRAAAGAQTGAATPPLSAEAPADNPDSDADDADSPATTSAAVARARPVPGAQAAVSYEDRVMLVADMIASGRWLGRATAKRLAKEWGIARGTVFDYARAGALVAKTDRGSVEQAREASLGHWQRIRTKALAQDDAKAAAAAQAGWDRAAGVVAPGGPRVQVNVMHTPGVKEFLQVVHGALVDRHPDALADVMAAVRAMLGAAAPSGGARPAQLQGG